MKRIPADSGGTSPQTNDALLDLLLKATDQASILHAVSGLLAAKGLRAPWSLPELTPVSDFVRAHLARKAKKVAASTLSGLTHALTAFQRHCRGMNLQDVRGEHCQSFVDALEAQHLSPGTITVMFSAVSAMFQRAVGMGHLKHNVCADVELPDSGSVVQRLPFEPSDIQRLLDFLRTEHLHEWQTMTLLGSGAGVRLADAAAMDCQAVKIVGDVTLLAFTPRKTGQPVEIPVFGETAAHLRAFVIQTGPMCPKLSKLDVSTLSRHFSTLLVRAGIDPMSVTLANGRMASRLSYHSCRHLFCTDLARRGVPESTRMAMSAHRTSCAHRKYTHIRGVDLAKQMEPHFAS